MLESLQSVSLRLVHTSQLLLSLVHVAMVHQSLPSNENLSSRMQRKPICAHVLLKMTVEGLGNVSDDHPSRFLLPDFFTHLAV